MHNRNTDHLVVIRNPNSTRSSEIDEKVIDPLNREGYDFQVYETKFANAEANIADMKETLPAGATAIIAGGDGTGMHAINSSLQGELDLIFGFTEIGNFNDQAKSRARRGQTVLDLLNAPVVENRPLTIEVDGQYWRHAPAYMTIGPTALATIKFGNAESREAMQNAPQWVRRARSLGQIGLDFLGNRKTLLPAFTVNDVYQDDATDIIAANSPRIGSIVRSKDPYYDKPYFGMRADINVSHNVASAVFGIQAISGHAPFERADEMRIVFEEAARIPVQTEGEFQWLDAKKIFVYKNPKDIVRVLQPKALPKL